MPLQFVSSSAEIFFWIFFALFLVGAAVRFALPFSRFKENLFLSALFRALPMLFWGAALVCLAPSLPIVFLSAFFFAFGGALFALSEKHKAFLFAAVVFGITATLLPLCAIISLFAQKAGVPLALFWILLPVFAAAGGGAAAGFISQKKSAAEVVLGILTVLYLTSLVFLLGFSAALLSVMFLYSVVFAVLGALALFSGEWIVRRYAKKLSARRGEIYPVIPFYLGEVLLSLGLVLSMFAASI